jgi:hypothetical protein
LVIIMTIRADGSSVDDQSPQPGRNRFHTRRPSRSFRPAPPHHQQDPNALPDGDIRRPVPWHLRHHRNGQSQHCTA